MTGTDEAAVRAVLIEWYDAMTRHDMLAVAAVLTPDFLLVEHDQLLDAATLVEGLTLGIEAGHQTAELSEFDIVIADDVAWSTHRNHEVWHPTSGDPTELEFLETVILRRSGPSWLIGRYHATRLRPITMPTDIAPLAPEQQVRQND